MDRRRAAAALLALAATIACSTAAPTANNQTSLELLDGNADGCYYNFQHYGEGDRIMTNEPCLNCTCHNRMLMCYLRVCPFTKPIGQDCTVEKRADQCCPIVTCPDVPVDLLTSTSTSSPAEYGSTGIGKYDRYGCSINGKYFSEGSKVPSAPNKPCEHCYCIRNMTTCVMQECTLHVEGCTPIYHKEVCCPVRYSCDHPEDEIKLLNDMTTTERPTPGYILTTTTVSSVTQMTQDCVHDDQIFSDGALIKTEKACEHCYCMKGDIVCVVQECGTPMENEGKNCTSLPPRHGQCCPDTYICEGDDRGNELTTETIDQSTQPPRRAGVEGSGFRNEPDEPYTEMVPYETDIEGSGEDDSTSPTIETLSNVITEKVSPDMIDEMLLSTTDSHLSEVTDSDQDQNTIPDSIPDKVNTDIPIPEHQPLSTEANTESVTTLSELMTTVSDKHKNIEEILTKQEVSITTESTFRKEDDNIIPDEIITLKDNDRSTTSIDLIIETTQKSIDAIDKTSPKENQMLDKTTSEDDIIDRTTTKDKSTDQHIVTQSIEFTTEKENNKEITTENQLILTTADTKIPEDISKSSVEQTQQTDLTTIVTEKSDIPETTSVVPVTNNVEDSMLYPGRIPGEGDCLMNGITYNNNTLVPSTNDCHTSCKCISSIIKCDPIICSPPPEYMENMNDCKPIYDSPDACCPTYVCSGKETIPPESHSQMSGTETPSPMKENDCGSKDCALDEGKDPIPDPTSTCKSGDCLHTPDKGHEQTHIPEDCTGDKCENNPIVPCDGDKCKPVDFDSNKKIDSEIIPTCDENGDCQKPQDTEQKECKDDKCIRKDSPQFDKMKPEIPEKHVPTSPTERSTDALDVTKQEEAYTEHSDITKTPQISTEQEVLKDESVQPEFLSTQKITDTEDDLVITEKTSSPYINEDSESTEETSSESDKPITELPDAQEHNDKITEKTQTEPVTTVKYSFHDESLKPDTKSTEQATAITENLQIYTEATFTTTMSEDKKSDDKSTTTTFEIKSTATTDTIKETSEISETKEESTTLSASFEAGTIKQTEIFSTEATFEIPPVTNKPLEDSTKEAEKKITKSPESYVTMEDSTDKTTVEMVVDHTKPDLIKGAEDTTIYVDVTTELNKILPDHSQSIPTQPYDDSKENTDIPTESDHVYTEAPEYLSTKVDEIFDSTEQTVRYTDSIPTTQTKTQISEIPITEKDITSTEGSEPEKTSVQTSDNEKSEELENPITVSHDLVKKLDETVTEPITEKQFDITVTEKESFEILESSTTVNVEINTDKPKTTLSDELNPNTQEINRDSSSDVSDTTTGPDLITKENVTEIPTQDSEKSVTTEIVPESETIEKSTTMKFIEQSTENSNIATAATSLDTSTESVDVITGKQTITDDQGYDKEVTTVDNSSKEEATTVALEVMVPDSQTETSLDENTQIAVTQMSTEPPVETVSKDIDVAIDQTPEPEKILTTSSILSSQQEERMTEKYSTESQTVNYVGTVEQQDLTTESRITDKEETTTFKADDEEISRKTTAIPQQLNDNEKEFTSPFGDSEIPSTTSVGITFINDKESEPVSQTMSNNNDANTNKPISDVTMNEVFEMTTTKSEDVITPKVTLPSEHDILTDKAELPNTSEIYDISEIMTTEASLLTTEKTTDDKNIVPTITSTESVKDFTEDEIDEIITVKPVSKNENEEELFISSTLIPSLEDSVITESSVPPVTDNTRKTSSGTDKKTSDDESTTKKFYDQTKKEENIYTLNSDQYTTEPQIQNTDDVSKESGVYTNGELMSTENPVYKTTIYENKVTLSTLGENITEHRQETATDDQVTESERNSDVKTTLSYNIEDTEGTTSIPKEEILGDDDDKTTSHKHSSRLPENEITTKMETGTELPSDEITTLPSRRSQYDGTTMTETVPKDEFELTTIYYDIQSHETITDKINKHEPSDISESQTQIITTESIQSSTKEENQADTTTYSSMENIRTDKPSEMVTESKQHEVTQDSDINEITSTEVSNPTSEKQEFETSDFIKKDTTESTNLNTKKSDESTTEGHSVVTPSSEDSNESLTDHLESTTSIVENQTHSKDTDALPVTEATDSSSQLPKLTTTQKKEEHSEVNTQSSIENKNSEPPVTEEDLENITTETHLLDASKTTDKYFTTNLDHKYSETTPYIELTEHTHRLVDELTTKTPLEEITTEISNVSPERGDQIPDDLNTSKDENYTNKPSKTTVYTHIDDIIETTVTPLNAESEITVFTEKHTASTPVPNKFDEVNKEPTTYDDEAETSTLSQIIKEYTTELNEIQHTSSASTSVVEETSTRRNVDSEKSSTPELLGERTTPEVTKATTSKSAVESATYLPPHTDKTFKPEEPFDTMTSSSTQSSDNHKLGVTDEPTEEMSSPDMPPSGNGAYGSDEYIDEDQPFGPGTCRYGGKVYVSAQQIPRDDPCDFCFCFRSDIICLQQSCPPPIHGCHEEPIQGFCCPRYECPVSMATTLNVTTTTTTTTTTLPPHFLPHAYKGAAQRKGCQIKGHSYKVGEVVRASSGPCLHCTCGGDGQMKCDPKACTPEPMLRQMIAAAVSAKRRR